MYYLTCKYGILLCFVLLGAAQSAKSCLIWHQLCYTPLTAAPSPLFPKNVELHLELDSHGQTGVRRFDTNLVALGNRDTPCKLEGIPGLWELGGTLELYQELKGKLNINLVSPIRLRCNRTSWYTWMLFPAFPAGVCGQPQLTHRQHQERVVQPLQLNQRRVLLLVLKVFHRSRVSNCLQTFWNVWELPQVKVIRNNRFWNKTISLYFKTFFLVLLRYLFVTQFRREIDLFKQLFKYVM